MFAIICLMGFAFCADAVVAHCRCLHVDTKASKKESTVAHLNRGNL